MEYEVYEESDGWYYTIYDDITGDIYHENGPFDTQDEAFDEAELNSAT